MKLVKIITFAVFICGSAWTSPAFATNPNCPQGNAYADGCLRAQRGTPQNPTLLNMYGANRPPWNVAGVDYPTGYTGTLKDPTVSRNLPSCASYSTSAGNHNNLVEVTNAPCTLDHLDFSLYNGICVEINAGINNDLITFTNDNFKAGTGTSNNCENGLG
ncbi:MAG: hypothetical protein WBW81_02425, partial [Methylocella sp.]